MSFLQRGHGCFSTDWRGGNSPRRLRWVLCQFGGATGIASDASKVIVPEGGAVATVVDAASLPGDVAPPAAACAITASDSIGSCGTGWPQLPQNLCPLSMACPQCLQNMDQTFTAAPVVASEGQRPCWSVRGRRPLACSSSHMSNRKSADHRNSSSALSSRCPPVASRCWKHLWR